MTTVAPRQPIPTSIWQTREADNRSRKTLATLDVGKLRLERHNGAPKIFARAFVQGKLVVRTTGEQTLPAATKVATDWYLELRDRMRRGERLHGRSFAYCADAFLEHADLLREVSDGQRKNYEEKWNLLKEHFDGVKVTDVDTKFLLELREKRSRKQNKNGQQSVERIVGFRKSTPSFGMGSPAAHAAVPTVRLQPWWFMVRRVQPLIRWPHVSVNVGATAQKRKVSLRGRLV